MREVNEKFGEYFTYFTLAIWFSSEVLLNSYIEHILFWKNADFNHGIAVLTTVLLLANVVFIQKYELSETIILGICSGAILIATVCSGYNIMMSTWLFVISGKQIQFDKVVKLTYIILIITVGFIFCLHFGGMIEEKIMYRGEMIRHSLGFRHPNWLGIRVFQIVLMHFYIKRKAITIFDYVFLIAAAWFVYKVPNCQTAYYATFIFLCMTVIFEISDVFIGGRKLFSTILIILAVLSNVGSVLLSIINVNNYSALKIIDHVMSKRFSWCYKAINYYGINLFGHNVDLYSRNLGNMVRKFYLDTAYVAILIRYGILVYLIFSILYVCAMIYFKRSNNFMMVIILSTYAIYGIMENTFFSMTQNIFLLALSFPLFSMKLDYNDGIVERKRVRYKLTL